MQFASFLKIIWVLNQTKLRVSCNGNYRSVRSSSCNNFTISEISVRSRAHEIQEDWKPSFLSNEEFTHLVLEVLLANCSHPTYYVLHFLLFLGFQNVKFWSQAVDGFILVFSATGKMFYVSESVTSLLGHHPVSSKKSYQISWLLHTFFSRNLKILPTHVSHSSFFVEWPSEHIPLWHCLWRRSNRPIQSHAWAKHFNGCSKLWWN